MKVIIEGHTVVVNKMSLYIDGKMEFQALNMIAEYGQKLNGCKYAVATRYSQERLEELYKENLKKFSPYIYLTEAQYEPIRESNNNNSKFQQREINCHTGYEYQEEISESGHRCKSLLSDPEPDALTRMIQVIEDEEFQKKEELMKHALASLPEIQRKRALKFFVEGKSFREIAESEGTYHSSVKKSVEAAEKAIKKYFKKVF